MSAVIGQRAAKSSKADVRGEFNARLMFAHIHTGQWRHQTTISGPKEEQLVISRDSIRLG